MFPKLRLGLCKELSQRGPATAGTTGREIGKIYPNLFLLLPSDLLLVPPIGQNQPEVSRRGSSRDGPRGQPPASLSEAWSWGYKWKPTAQEVWF